ncbi:cytochrome c3 family protein [Neorhizobium galegae]|uniref:cytochrome c3 family protein n=1 Tax=Neorhizobium galegae TaxID=399 RepID=UPI00351D9973
MLATHLGHLLDDDCEYAGQNCNDCHNEHKSDHMRLLLLRNVRKRIKFGNHSPMTLTSHHIPLLKGPSLKLRSSCSAPGRGGGRARRRPGVLPG